VVRNPDGSLKLRHVGFLGAVPPEVKGLRDVKFAEAGFQTFEFSEEEEMNEDEMNRTFG
jgi:hypothetical protein